MIRVHWPLLTPPLLHPDFSVSPARLTISFATQRSPSAGETVQWLHPRQCCQPHAPSLCHHHTPPLHRIAVAIISIIAITTVATNTKAPCSNGHSSQCAAHDVVLRPACVNAHTLALAQTALPHHNDAQAVHRTCAWHQHHCWGPHAGLGTLTTFLSSLFVSPAASHMSPDMPSQPNSNRPITSCNILFMAAYTPSCTINVSSNHYIDTGTGIPVTV